MAETSARFALPYLAAGQAQKEMFHNEALARIDAALHPAAQAIGQNVPPPTPAAGQCWIVGGAPSDAWTGQAQALAVATEGGWRFVAPTIGMTVWLTGDNLSARYDGTAWRVGEIAAARLLVGGRQVVGASQPSIPDPDGGTTIDDAARTAVTRVIAALRTHGLID